MGHNQQHQKENQGEYRKKSKGHIKKRISTMSAKRPGPRLRYDCAVKGCRPSTYKVHSYHRIPSKDNRSRVDPRRQLWIEACHLMDADLRDRMVICGMHFKDTDYQDQGKKRLRTTAVPSQNLPEPDEQQVGLWNLVLEAEADIKMLEGNAAADGDADNTAEEDRVIQKKTPRLRYDCAVKGCRPSTHKIHGYHKIPSKDNRGRVDPRRQLWIEACHLTDAGLRGRMVICGSHFKEADYHQEGKKRLRFTAVPSQNLPGPDEQKVNLWNLDIEADIKMLEANTAGGGNGDIPVDDADTAEENPLAIEPESAALDIKPEIWTKDVASLATKSLEPSAKDRAIQTKTQDKDQTIADLLKQVENLKRSNQRLRATVITLLASEDD